MDTLNPQYGSWQPRELAETEPKHSIVVILKEVAGQRSGLDAIQFALSINDPDSACRWLLPEPSRLT